MLKWTPVVKAKNQYGQPRSFLPPGRTHAVIYAVSLKAQPGIVKVGRTTKWDKRRNHYANWNLSNGDGIAEERVFCITEEFVDLTKLEAAILARMPFPLAYGAEWFRADLDEVCRLIDSILLGYDLTYT